MLQAAGLGVAYRGKPVVTTRPGPALTTLILHAALPRDAAAQFCLLNRKAAPESPFPSLYFSICSAGGQAHHHKPHAYLEAKAPSCSQPSDLADLLHDPRWSTLLPGSVSHHGMFFSAAGPSPSTLVTSKP